MHETLQILLQEGGAHAGNGDAVAVTELEHRVAMDVGGDRRRQLLHVLNVGEVVELDRVVLRIEVVDRLRALTRVEHERVVAGTADGDGGTGAGGGRRVEDDRAAMPVRCLFQIAEVEIVYRDRRKDRMASFIMVMTASPLASSEKQTSPTATPTQIDFI